MRTDRTGAAVDARELLRDQIMARRMVRSAGVGRHDVADVTQEVMLAVCLCRDRFEVPPGQSREVAWRSFLWSITQRHVAAHRRAMGRLRAGERGAARHEEELAQSIEDAMIAREPVSWFRAALGELRGGQPALHELVVMFLDGASVAEIAAAQRVPVMTAWNRLRLARIALQETVRRWKASDACLPWRAAIANARRAAAQPRPHPRASISRSTRARMSSRVARTVASD